MLYPPKKPFKDLLAQRVTSFEFLGEKKRFFRKKKKAFDRPIVRYFEEETTSYKEPTFCDAIKENKKKTDDNFVDKIKNFFCNFKCPSCCDCDEIKNEETNEINTSTLKTPLKSGDLII